MRESRFSEEQMVAIPREADRTTVAEAAKKHAVSEPTIYAWRKHFGQIHATDVKHLKALELENARLKTARTGQPGLRAGPFATPRLRAARGVAPCVELRVAHAHQGRTRDDG